MSHYQQPRPLKVVAVSGGLNTPSKTESLLDAILNELQNALAINVHYIKLSEIGTGLGGVISRNDLPASVQQALSAIETADVLIVGTPVYRASFTGLFKHLFDFVDQFALVDVPVLLAASGGSDRHALVLEHQLRPLFSFFQAQTLPIGVYATDQDFTNYQVSSSVLLERIKLAATRALPVFQYAATLPARQTNGQHKQGTVKLNQPIAQPAVLPSAQASGIAGAGQELPVEQRNPATFKVVNG
ncbi:FMN reductase [Alkanindiges illinoisensis]|uniref:FMN reductase n=1 Tax=Alkanindiges illinoisensis TaxID=197183 RepID=UPI000A053A02